MYMSCSTRRESPGVYVEPGYANVFERVERGGRGQVIQSGFQVKVNERILHLQLKVVKVILVLFCTAL